MDVERTGDARTFLDSAASTLLRQEARHNLMLGVADAAARHPAMYSEFRGWIVRDGSDIVGTATHTPPFSVIVGAPARAGVLDTLVESFVEDSIDVVGITGAVPEVRDAAGAWCDRTGESQTVRVHMGIYELTEVAPVPEASGTARPAAEADRDLLIEWHIRFAADVGDAGSPPMRDVQRIATNVDTRLAGESAGYWLWVDADETVSLAGYSGPTGSGIRVGPVYTPQGHRGNGYATCLVAAMSAWLLSAGYRTCFLFTDLQNPTSNAIYERIGYRKVFEALDITFTS